MIPTSPANALGPYARVIRQVLIDVVRSRHERSAEAHQVMETRYAIAYGGMWRDLLDDIHEALTGRGFQSHKMLPGGYQVPVVNNCLVYVCRLPDSPDAVSSFASSPTRKNGFTAQPPEAMLFKPGYFEGDESHNDASEESELHRALRAVPDTMPVVLVTVQSSPLQLQSIRWGIAMLDESGAVNLRGQELLWEPESGVDTEVSEVESFDQGTPVVPPVELREQKDRPDA
ncbi:hypothetical protein [Leekyejoonella antrihumi]|uniref:Uncharacterized protein n=1 Tax=Leekyejoonella antrihumi TaxID=1660198 RepID=A0A563DS00_9MICO|nr:hypothetical protein [Leekyejoonella antrihumi]TWP33005.1 hypothetical protein FGL98_22685 [Leekyejoonella antrihumi]